MPSPLVPAAPAPRAATAFRATHSVRAVMRFLGPLVFFPLVFWGQSALGEEISTFPLHTVAVAHMTWEFGRRGAVAGVLLSVLLWYLGSVNAGWTYSAEWVRWYNAIIRGAVHAFSASMLLLLQRTIELHRQHIEGMRALLDVCHGCGAVRGSDGVWVPMDEVAHYAARRHAVQECEACGGTHHP